MVHDTIPVTEWNRRHFTRLHNRDIAFLERCHCYLHELELVYLGDRIPDYDYDMAAEIEVAKRRLREIIQNAQRGKR